MRGFSYVFVLLGLGLGYYKGAKELENNTGKPSHILLGLGLGYYKGCLSINGACRFHPNLRVYLPSYLFVSYKIYK
jgi:hypothetical protein